jgi:hypothetical protein
VHDWANLWAWEERRAELVREVERRRLVRELREARGSRVEERSGDGYRGPLWSRGGRAESLGIKEGM